MIQNRQAKAITGLGCLLALVALLLPWMAVRGVDGSGRSGLTLVGGLVGVALVGAGSVTAFGPKRRLVADPTVPAAAGMTLATVGAVMVVVRAVVAPGPASAASFIDRQFGLWIVLAGSGIAWIGLAANWWQLNRRRRECESRPAPAASG